MALKDIVITASINSYPTLSYGQKTFIASTDEQSFPVETVIGGQAGVWPRFNGTDYTTNLFVNVTQSWSGSNITPLGIVPFIHNTEEEFFNGEFSGSILDVTNGNLTDPDCEQFLQINTTPINYNIFTFYKNTIGFDQFSVLLNVFTAPNPGEVYLGLFNFDATKSYAMYVKIARLDANGIDNTLSLQELKQFRYTDTTAGEIICDIVNITEYPTYYFYEVTSNTLTAFPTNINTIDYDLSVTSAPSQFLGTNIDYLVSNWVVGTDAAGGFNSGNYTFSGTPNSTITFTVSGQFTPPVFGPGSQTIDFGIADITDPSPILISYTTVTISSTNQLVTHNASITNFTSGRTYCIFVRQGIGPTAGMEVNTLTWTFNSAPAQSSTNFFILEPYLTSTFRNSDCDVLMNNYSENDYSRLYREVLYDNGGVIPSNIQQIISGTAQFAEINDYLYHASANRLPRYNGVRSESPNFNLSTTEGGYGTLPNVENLQTYFASFDYFQGTTGELLDKSAAHITYLIDKDGTVFTPSLSSSYYWNLIDNFETDKNANVIIYNEDGDKVTLGNKRILRPGALPRAIIESQIGYDPKVINNISFGTSTITADEGFDYNYIAAYGPLGDDLVIVPITNDPDGEGGAVIPLTLIISGSDSPTIDLNGGDFTLRTKKGNDSILLQFELTLVASIGLGNNIPSTFTPLISFQYSDTDGASWTSFSEDNSQAFSSGGAAKVYTSSTFSPVKNRLYRVYFSWISSTGDGQVFLRSTMPSVAPGLRTQLKITQVSGGGPNVMLNYQSKYALNNDYAFIGGGGGGYNNLPLYTVLQNALPNIDLSNEEIVIGSTSNRTRLNFNATLNTYASPVPGFSATAGDIYVDFVLQKYTALTGTWSNIYTENPKLVGNPTANPGGRNTVFLNFPVNEYPVVGDKYRIVFTNPLNSSQDQFVIKINSFVQVTQVNATAPIITNPNSASIYWTTGSSPASILSSSYFAPYWTGNDGLYVQNSISDIYGPNLPFTIQPYTDVIRFEGDENQVYVITNVGFNSNLNSGFDSNFLTWIYSGVNWTSNAAGTIASCIGGGDTLSQTITSNLISGNSYSISFEVINYTGGSLLIELDGTSYGTAISANGTYSISIPAGSPPHNLTFRSQNFIGSITNVTFNGSDPFIYVEVSPSITPGTNINSFLIRRYHPNPNFITLDSSIISGSGFLLPEYTTNEIKQNFDNIIVNLRERGLV